MKKKMKMKMEKELKKKPTQRALEEEEKCA